MSTNACARARAQVERLGGRVLQRECAHIDEAVRAAGVDGLVVNCTGLGSLRLGGVADAALHPVRGQTRLVRVADAAWQRLRERGAGGRGTGAAGDRFWSFQHPARAQHPVSLIARTDGVYVLNGRRDVHSFDLRPDPTQALDVEQRCAAIAPEWLLRGRLVLADRVGLRPARVGGARLEAELRGAGAGGHSVCVVHCYGHGGDGVVESVACAEEVAALALRHRPALRTRAAAAAADRSGLFPPAPAARL